jgi:hypothetical protein
MYHMNGLLQHDVWPCFSATRDGLAAVTSPVRNMFYVIQSAGDSQRVYDVMMHYTSDVILADFYYIHSFCLLECRKMCPNYGK